MLLFGMLHIFGEWFLHQRKTLDALELVTVAIHSTTRTQNEKHFFKKKKKKEMYTTNQCELKILVVIHHSNYN
jgi:hypothetical protein